MGRDHLDVLVAEPAVVIFVLDPCIRKAHVAVVVRQVVLARPARDLLGLPIGRPSQFFRPRLCSCKKH